VRLTAQVDAAPQAEKGQGRGRESARHSARHSAREREGGQRGLLQRDEAALILADFLGVLDGMFSLYERSSEVDEAVLASLALHFRTTPVPASPKENALIDASLSFDARPWKRIPGSVNDSVSYFQVLSTTGLWGSSCAGDGEVDAAWGKAVCSFDVSAEKALAYNWHHMSYERNGIATQANGGLLRMQVEGGTDIWGGDEGLQDEQHTRFFASSAKSPPGIDDRVFEARWAWRRDEGGGYVAGFTYKVRGASEQRSEQEKEGAAAALLGGSGQNRGARAKRARRKRRRCCCSCPSWRKRAESRTPPRDQAAAALLRQKRAESRAVGGRPPEPPLPEHMCDRPHAMCSAAHVLGRTRPGLEPLRSDHPDPKHGAECYGTLYPSLTNLLFQDVHVLISRAIKEDERAARSTLGTTQGFWRFTPVAENVCRGTFVFQVAAGGRIPVQFMNWGVKMVASLSEEMMDK
jgi:hypothetical protein